MRFRWDFAVMLSGWGETAEKAWENCQEGIETDGLGSCPDVVPPYDAKAFRRAVAMGRDAAQRAEPEESAPDGCLLVWED